MKKIPVILDTDIGTDIDDTWALVMLLNSPELDVKLITTVSGDTYYRAKIVAKFLEIAERTDIPIGIGMGNPKDSLNFQEPWIKDFDLDRYKGKLYDGVDAIVDTIKNSKEPVTIISIGIATNIAKALEISPDIVKKSRFVGMHGSIYKGYGGKEGREPEANVRYDVPSIRKVFSSNFLDKIITPLDTCGIVKLEGERYEKILNSENPLLKALIENYKIWSELVPWTKVDYQIESSTLFDTVAIYLAYSQNFLEIEPIKLKITDEGLTVPDEDGEEIEVAIRWKNYEAFLNHLIERLKP
ncbi:MAG: nucleoside hydrolase [Dictyoglomus sp.]|nr:nucleoside hydrolase [Dictyoglomus sp.]MDW8188864.1 nucleoside hydrolase [Dictyoglomus sp.]